MEHQLIDALAHRLCAALGESPEGMEARVVEGRMHSVTFLDKARWTVREVLAGLNVTLHNEGFDSPAGPRHMIVSLQVAGGPPVPVIRDYYGDGGISHCVTGLGIARALSETLQSEEA